MPFYTHHIVQVVRHLLFELRLGPQDTCAFMALLSQEIFDNLYRDLFEDQVGAVVRGMQLYMPDPNKPPVVATPLDYDLKTIIFGESDDPYADEKLLAFNTMAYLGTSSMNRVECLQTYLSMVRFGSQELLLSSFAWIRAIKQADNVSQDLNGYVARFQPCAWRCASCQIKTLDYC